MKNARKIDITRYENVRGPYYAEVEIDDYPTGKYKSFYLGHEKYGVKILMWQMPIFDDSEDNSDVPDNELIDKNIDSYIEMHDHVYQPSEEDDEE